MRVHHIALRTHDLDRLGAFYREVLGLRSLRARQGTSEWLALGEEAVLMLERAAPEEPPIPAGSMELLAFAVDEGEREAVLSRLHRAGGAVESQTEHTRYFRDPDGRRVAVSTYPL